MAQKEISIIYNCTIGQWESPVPKLLKILSRTFVGF